MIARLSEEHGAPCGFSDHSEGIEAAPLAVAAGACIIEKHFTLDRSRPDFDHRLSLEPAEFARMIVKIRVAEAMLGRGEKAMSGQERESARTFHRCLVARRDIAPGARLDEENVGVMRVSPGQQGLPPNAYESVLGRRAARAVARFAPLHDADVADAE